MDPITRLSALGAAGGGGFSDYWIDKIKDVSTNTFVSIWGSYMDSSGNIYDAGYIQDTNKRSFVVKRDPAGVIQWARGLSYAGYDVTIYNMKSDGTYLYCAGNGYDGTSFVGFIAAYDFNGTLQWQKAYTGLLSFFYFDVDSSGNLFTAERTGSFTTRQLVVAKMNNQGVVQWTKGFYNRPGGLSTSTNPRGLCVDSGGNLIVSAEMDGPSNSNTASTLIKIDTNGTVLYNNMYTTGTGSNDCSLVDTDSSNNIYWSIYYSGSNYIAKLDSSLTQLTSRLSVGRTVFPYIDIDDTLRNTFNADGLDATTLDYVYARGGSMGNPIYYGKLPGSDGIYMHSQSSSWSAYIPADGSLPAGGYVHPVYGSFGYSYQTHALGAGTTFALWGSASVQTPSVTSSTGVLTDAALSLSNSPYFIA